MVTKNEIIVGLDIGTSFITSIIGEVQPGGKVHIIGVGRQPSRGLRKGVVINIESTVQSIRAAVQSAQEMAGKEVHSVIALISGAHIKGFNSHGIVGIKNREVSAFDVEKVIDAAKAVAIPLDREILHVVPQEYIIDEQDGIREPIGISGVRLEARVHIVTGSLASSQNIVKCANRCGLTVSQVVASPLASARAVLSPEESELGVCLVDIGGGTCDIAIFQNGAVRHTAVLSLGGNHITSDIAAGLRTPIAAAEEIKRNYGVALVSSVGRDETIEVPSTGGRSGRMLSKLVLAEIIEPRVVEVFNLIQKEIIRAGCEGYLTSGVVLTGGTAQLGGICELGEQVFNVPIRVGTPQGVGGLTDLVSSSEYSAVVGLLLQGADSRQGKRHVEARSPFVRIFRRASNWFAENF